MKIILLSLLLAISICNAQKTEKTTVTIPNAPGLVYEVGNGEIFESAIKIKNAKNKNEGIDAEKKYLESLLSDKTYRSLIFSVFYKHSGCFILD